MNMSISPKVSVIVPVYNREQYLRQCVDSICMQTLRDIEIILVDDGSTDGSANICDEYAGKDLRVRVVHKQNAGMGAAYNTGIAAARGEYIGFVESDDWIEPEMYEKLYTKAIEEDVDIVKSLFTRVEGEQRRMKNQYGNPYGSQVFHRRIENVLENAPTLAYGHYSTWSAIYRRQFLRDFGILWPERPGGSMSDIDFHWRTYTQVRSFYLLAASYYNYRLDVADSSINQGYKTAMEALHAFYETLQWLLNKEVSEKVLGLIFRAIYLSARHHNLQNCHGLDRIRHAKMLSKAFLEYVPHMNFDEFRAPEKKEFLFMLHHPSLYVVRSKIYRKLDTPSLRYRKFLGIVLYKKRVEPTLVKCKILGIPIKREEIRKEGTRIRILGLPGAKKRKGNVEKQYFLGVRYRTKKLEPADADDIRFTQIMAHVNAITDTHRKTFSKYKNCHAGKDIALVATGPTLNYFVPLNDCIYVGLNKAVSYSKIHYDYLFFQDYAHNQAREILKLMGQYRDAKKFYGILQDAIATNWIIPESVAIRDHAERYYVISQWKYPPVHFTYDIANEPLGDSGNVAFAAMQFIMWTNPRRVFLVGSDATSAYFDNSFSTNKGRDSRRWVKGWTEFKNFARTYYPDTEIISVNPVGLRGLFTDVYTEEYLHDNPDITEYALLHEYLSKKGGLS